MVGVRNLVVLVVGMMVIVSAQDYPDEYTTAWCDANLTTGSTFLNELLGHTGATCTNLVMTGTSSGAQHDFWTDVTNALKTPSVDACFRVSSSISYRRLVVDGYSQARPHVHVFFCGEGPHLTSGLTLKRISNMHLYGFKAATGVGGAVNLKAAISNEFRGCSGTVTAQNNCGFQLSSESDNNLFIDCTASGFDGASGFCLSPPNPLASTPSASRNVFKTCTGIGGEGGGSGFLVGNGASGNFFETCTGLGGTGGSGFFLEGGTVESTGTTLQGCVGTGGEDGYGVSLVRAVQVRVEGGIFSSPSGTGAHMGILTVDTEIPALGDENDSTFLDVTLGEDPSGVQMAIFFSRTGAANVLVGGESALCGTIVVGCDDGGTRVITLASATCPDACTCEWDEPGFVPPDGMIKQSPGGCEGDPHFHAFHGGIFDVKGDPGHIYNIFSDKGIQVNVRFIQYPGDDMTYMGEVAIRIGHKSSVFLDTSGMAIFEPWAPLAEGVFQLEGGVEARFVGNDLTVEVPNSWQIRVKRMITLQRQYFHLDVDVETNDGQIPVGSDPHGLLGQTAHYTGPVTARGDQGEGVIEGTYHDYALRDDDILGTDFKFNRFTGEL